MTMIAFCGIGCTQCDTYRVIIADDNSLRRETANGWSKDFGFLILATNISCSGCTFKLCCEEKGISQTAGVAKSI
ncbi:hypothetical protein BG32_09275 [Mesotoga sp. HF07.pep.5.2.highcov]|uniref:DUF3795 domain-containing protein n=1 Tax=unclassified Mesotoga TaxID=1184398 RepID=UPI000C183607|nr:MULTISPECIES: DUF3795 domain-containing protein [unclassified Mesotoga]RLL92512.1 hypothetical protein BG32_09275 [Mesotoga sp. HF07.pep.5.2.highcov]